MILSDSGGQFYDGTSIHDTAGYKPRPRKNITKGRVLWQAGRWKEGLCNKRGLAEDFSLWKSQRYGNNS